MPLVDQECVVRWVSRVDWESAARAHRARAERWTGPYRKRKMRGEVHPVHDFLFTYYGYKPSLLERWHPGAGVGLLDADSSEWSPRGRAYRSCPSSGGIFADPAAIEEKEQARLAWIVRLLEAIEGRPARFACHGLHEWAMLYRAGEDAIRHRETLPLRLAPAEIDRVVEGRKLVCTHFDAFRFFTAPAVPRNQRLLERDGRLENEQAGCLHANMDLYKWAAKALPWVDSGLLLDCFELAMRTRELDMRASPYDVSALGLAAVAIETADGRAEYETEQREIAVAAEPLRRRLISGLRRVLESTR